MVSIVSIVPPTLHEAAGTSMWWAASARNVEVELNCVPCSFEDDGIRASRDRRGPPQGRAPTEGCLLVCYKTASYSSAAAWPKVLFHRCRRFTTSGWSKSPVSCRLSARSAAVDASASDVPASARPETAAAAALGSTSTASTSDPARAPRSARRRRAQIKNGGRLRPGLRRHRRRALLRRAPRAPRGGGSGSATTLWWRRSGAPSCQPRPTKRTRTMVMGRQNRGLLLCGIYERKRDADAAADGVGELILRMFRGTDSRWLLGPGAFPAGRDFGSGAVAAPRPTSAPTGRWRRSRPPQKELRSAVVQC